jgi:predicted RNase H-like HicB family nuclease
MILWWSNEDDCYVVDVPELPGCMAHGRTRAEAIQNAEEAISLWVQTAREDGIRVPKPKGRLLFA